MQTVHFDLPLSQGWGFSKTSASVILFSLCPCFSSHLLKYKALLSLATLMASYTVVIVPLRNSPNSLDALQFFLWVSLLFLVCLLISNSFLLLLLFYVCFYMKWFKYTVTELNIVLLDELNTFIFFRKGDKHTFSHAMYVLQFLWYIKLVICNFKM